MKSVEKSAWAVQKSKRAKNPSKGFWAKMFAIKELDVNVSKGYVMHMRNAHS
jgi:hypothetical protein